MRGVIVACFSLLVLGCEAKPGPPTKPTPLGKTDEAKTAAAKVDEAPPIPEGVRVEVRERKGSCVRTLCVGGPGDIGAHPNFDLNETCRRSPGVVQRCEGELCMGFWPRSEWKQGLAGLIESLDSNGDKKIDGADEPCSLRLGGWSTGAGLVMTEIPKRLAAIVDEGHAKIDHLLAVAPYVEPGPVEAIELPPTVATAFIYRTTQSSADDCSKTYPKGPWLSPKPVCGPGTTCYDYDYAQLGEELAYRGRRGSRSGNAVGHCNMSAIVATVGLDNLVHGREGYAHLVPPYADGQRGGREREHGKTLPRPESMAGASGAAPSGDAAPSE